MSEFIYTKQQQVAQYQAQAAWHDRRVGWFKLARVLSLPGIGLFGFAAFGFLLVWLDYLYMYDGVFFLVSLFLTLMSILGFRAAWIMVVNHRRSALLLTQLGDVILDVLEKQKNSPALMQSVQDVETKFLSNDDELFSKKKIWKGYLKHLKRLANLEQRHIPTDFSAWFPGRIDIGITWLDSDPLRLDYSDTTIIGACWRIRERNREAVHVPGDSTTKREKHIRYKRLDAMTAGNPLVFERLVRNEKISKELRRFMRRSKVDVLTAAAKMRLVEFVDSVLGVRPYIQGSDEYTLLTGEMNEDIHQYTDEFWRVHRRSLKYYAFEFLWMLTLAPFIAAAIATGSLLIGVPIAVVGVFFMAFGEMRLVTQQKIYMRGKKLMPALVANQIGIRHSMSSDVERGEESDNYREQFNKAEKHFLMTTNEIEAVKNVRDNLRKKLNRALGSEIDVNRETAERKLEIYYGKFNHYRRKSLRFVALELMTIILGIPAFFAVTWGAIEVIGYGAEWALIILFLIVSGVASLFIYHPHTEAVRRKDMLMVMYQEMVTLMEDPTTQRDSDRLAELLTFKENEAIEALVKTGRFHHKMEDLIDFIKQVRDADYQRLIEL